MSMFWKEIMGLWQLRARLATSSQEDGRWFLTYSDEDEEDDPCNGSDGVRTEYLRNEYL